MEFIFNKLEFVLCCGKIREEEEEEVHHRLHDYAASSSNRPLLPQRVGPLESIKKSQHKPKVNSPLPLINSVHNQPQKFPVYFTSQKPTEKNLSSDEVACLKKPILSETVLPKKPFKISHDTHSASSSAHNLPHKTLASDTASCLNKPQFHETVGPQKRNQDFSRANKKILAPDAAGCLYKPKLPEKVGTKIPIKISQDINKAGSEISQSSHKASDSVPLSNSSHAQSAKNLTDYFLASDGSCVGPIKPIEISSPPSISSVHGEKLLCSDQMWQPRRKKEMTVLGRQCGSKAAPAIHSVSLPCSKISQVHDQSQNSPEEFRASDTSSYNTLEMPKTAGFLKPISQDEHKVSCPLPSISSVQDESPKKPQMKQQMVIPSVKTKMVWVVSNRKPDINDDFESTGPVKMSEKEKQSSLRVFETTEQSNAKNLPEFVQNTQKSTYLLPSRQIWVKKSVEWFRSVEIEKPISISLDKQPIVSSLVGSSDSNESDDELVHSPQMLRSNKYKLPVYRIPEHVKELIEKDKVPEVLRKPLSLETYNDYFAALLYAEDFYHEKWADFLLKDVILELHEEKAKKEDYDSNKSQVDKKVFVKFEIDSVRERRPFLLSRDFVFAKHSAKKSIRFEGSISRVMKSIYVLAEFGDDFYSQHSPNDKYDVSFSFNRVCLKRCHQAIASAMDPSFHHLLFPKRFSFDSLSSSYQSNIDDAQIYSVVHKITSMQGPPLYLIDADTLSLSCLSLNENMIPTSRTKGHILEDIVEQAGLQILRNSPNHRILICASRNKTCDILAARFNTKIPESELFRANAAFRGIEDVNGEIMPICSHDGECFTTPSLSELRNFRVVTSTYVSSFRLRSCGAGHFTHIFLVEASGATEPETMIALANLVGENTRVVISGCKWHSPPRVRSDIGREKGLRRSYFHRLVESQLYCRDDF